VRDRGRALSEISRHEPGAGEHARPAAPRRLLGKPALLLGVAICAAALAVLGHHHQLLRRPEQLAVDARFQIRGTDRALTRGMVVVGIDDATFTAFQRQHLHAQWPFPRRYEARVIDRLRRDGARVIALDIQFTEPTDPIDDNALIRSVGRAGNVVLSTTEVGSHGATNVLGGDAVLRRIGARAGETSLVPDSDGTIRNTQYSILGLPTFGVAVAEAAMGRRVSESSFGGARTPVPIDYAGPTGTVPAISFSRVYDGDFAPGTFRGRIVVVGAASSTLQDEHRTPTSGGTDMSGPELLANAAATVLHGVPLRFAANHVTDLLIVGLALAICAAGIWTGTAGVAILGVVLLALWSVAAQVAFESGTILDFSDPAASLVLATGGAMVVGMWADGRERRRLRAQFAAGSEKLVAEVLHGSGSRPLEPTAIIGGYRLEDIVGRGGMGVVYRATQLALDRPVAVKLIATDRAQDPAFRERFTLESRAAAAIEHVNVIPVYEAGEDDGLLFIAMRLVDGIDLAHLLSEVQTLEPERAASIIGQLAGALDAAHGRGLVHRDVKPANALLTFDEPEHVYLTDFGLARHIGSGAGLTRADAWIGTLDYMAPEQLTGGEVSGAADTYALAGVLYQCLTGEVPFPRDNEAAKLWAHVNAPPPAPSRLRPDLPAQIDAVIARGMAKEPSARFATATDLARAAAEALQVTAARPSAWAGDTGAAAAPAMTTPAGVTVPTVISD
jgi:CHASE2 domain-containing sensor protein